MNQHDMETMAVHRMLSKLSDDPSLSLSDQSVALSRAAAAAARASSSRAPRDIMNCPF